MCDHDYGLLLGCAYPLLYENPECKDYPYSVWATGFLVRCAEQHWLITAKHNKVDPEQLLVFPRVGQQLSPHFEVAADGGSEDEDAGDFVILRVRPHPLLPSLDNAYGAFDLRADTVMAPDSADIHGFLTRGYPKLLLNNVDFQAQRLNRQRLDLELKYDSHGGIPECHRLSLVGQPPIAKLDWMSGSPVFALVEIAPDNYRAAFAGMALRAGGGYIRILDGCRLYQQLVTAAHQ